MPARQLYDMESTDLKGKKTDMTNAISAKEIGMVWSDGSDPNTSPLPVILKKYSLFIYTAQRRFWNEIHAVLLFP